MKPITTVINERKIQVDFLCEAFTGKLANNYVINIGDYYTITDGKGYFQKLFKWKQHTVKEISELSHNFLHAQLIRKHNLTHTHVKCEVYHPCCICYSMFQYTFPRKSPHLLYKLSCNETIL